MRTQKTISGRIMACTLVCFLLISQDSIMVLAEENEHLDTLTAGVASYMEGDEENEISASEEEPEKEQIQQTEEMNQTDEEAEEEVSLVAGEAEARMEAEEEEAEQVDLDTLVMANVSDSVNVREEADEESAVAGKLFKNCGGIILEQNGDWTKIQSGNLTGWAKNEYLLFGEEAAALREEAGTLKATITTDALRVRKEASEEAGVYGLVKNGETLVAVEQSDDWVAVQYDEDTVGYVSTEFATLEFTVETGKTTKEIEDEERAKELEKLSKNQGAVPTSVSDVTLLAALIQCEAGSQSYEGQLAVGAVVMNRVRSGGYPGSIIGVITAPGQFPPATNGKVAAIAARGPKVSCMQAAQAAVDGATNVGGATHFNRVGAHPGIVIGSHVFW